MCCFEDMITDFSLFSARHYLQVGIFIGAIPIYACPPTLPKLPKEKQWI